MRIFIAVSSTAVGGQELAVLLHTDGLLKRGYHLHLILEPGSPIARMAEEKKLPVLLLSMRRSHYPRAILQFRTLLKHHRPAIIQLISSRDSWIGSLAARLVRPDGRRRPDTGRTVLFDRQDVGSDGSGVSESYGQIWPSIPYM